MKSYLSIDIDYWWNYDDATQALKPLFKSALKRGIPIHGVMNHQQLLPFVNDSKAELLINVDQHSDVNSSNIDKLECGSWVSYVKHRKNSAYLWIRNYIHTKAGNCNGNQAWDDDSDWGYIESRYCDNRFLKLNQFLKGCVGIGFCMSPNYSNYSCIDAFRHLIKEYKIPYMKGLKKEDHYRNICPPYRTSKVDVNAERLRKIIPIW